MKASKYTRKRYEEALNYMQEEFWLQAVCGRYLIAGKWRKGKYGYLLRKYDPIAFEVGFNEWKREAIGHI